MRLLDQLKQHNEKTYEHSLRVAEYSGEIAGLEGKIKYSAYLGGLYHDIGKLMIDKNLLDRYKITPEQYAEIKKHVRYGYDFLAAEKPFEACIAGKHHPDYAVKEWPEKYTATDREEISEYIKIVTFADFFDALMTRNNNAYKVNQENKEEVFAKLKEYFPKQERWMETLWNIKQEQNPSEK